MGRDFKSVDPSFQPSLSVEDLSPAVLNFIVELVYHRQIGFNILAVVVQKLSIFINQRLYGSQNFLVIFYWFRI